LTSINFGRGKTNFRVNRKCPLVFDSKLDDEAETSKDEHAKHGHFQLVNGNKNGGGGGGGGGDYGFFL
jgi:hypothetical protein